MRKHKGMHFYINICNFDDAVEKEELESRNVNHSIHALNTFFSTIEWFGMHKYGDRFVIEKITGARLHMYVLDSVVEAYEVVKDVSLFAHKLMVFINKNVSKYKKLIDMKIQVGACYGQFYDFIFEDDDYEEETTIGFAPNYAAKLQNISADGYISIASSLYDELDDCDAEIYERLCNPKITKYEQLCYYTAKLSDLSVVKNNFEDGLNYAYNLIQETNLADMNNEQARILISPENLSVKNIKRVTGIPLFADVRGFTQQFNKDDVNLTEMADKTRKILKSMYAVVKDKGVHIQFQGDREFALFHDYSDQRCTVNAVIAAMKIIDRIKGYSVNVGVGESVGTVFASRIGARGNKDNILIGRTVSEADRFEDDFAKENQLVISRGIYSRLKDENPVLAKQFTLSSDGYYITQLGYNEYLEAVEDENLAKNNQSRNYNGAWCKMY